MPIEYRPNPSKDLEAEWRRAGWTDRTGSGQSLELPIFEEELARIAIRGLNGDSSNSELLGGIFSSACLDGGGRWYVLPIQSVNEHRVQVESVS